MGIKGVAIGFGVGYVLGAKAGRERYNQLVDWWNKFAGNPTVQKAAENARHVAGDAGRKGMEAVQGGVTKVSSAVKNRLGEDSDTPTGYATGT